MRACHRHRDPAHRDSRLPCPVGTARARTDPGRSCRRLPASEAGECAVARAPVRVAVSVRVMVAGVPVRAPPYVLAIRATRIQNRKRGSAADAGRRRQAAAGNPPRRASSGGGGAAAAAAGGSRGGSLRPCMRLRRGRRTSGAGLIHAAGERPRQPVSRSSNTAGPCQAREHARPPAAAGSESSSESVGH
jgi:hypothetical protein